MRTTLTFHCPRLGFAAIAALLGGCAATPKPPAGATPHAIGYETQPTTDSEAAVVGASLGATLRREYPAGFSVYPRFVTPPAVAWLAAHHKSSAADRQLLDAVRRAGSANWADTMSLRDTAGVRGLPESSIQVLALSGPIELDGDSARAAVLSADRLNGSGQEVHMSVFWYVFSRSAGRWRFVRRQLLYAT